jgi:ABC-type multidrug transport system fused ATPase/permease subunit
LLTCAHFFYILPTATPGEVVNVFMAILIGSISLAQLAPEMQAVNYACGAAAKLYETIDRIPGIDSSDFGGLKPKKVEGHITFENVKFNYPSRPNVGCGEGPFNIFPSRQDSQLSLVPLALGSQLLLLWSRGSMTHWLAWSNSTASISKN